MNAIDRITMSVLCAEVARRYTTKPSAMEVFYAVFHQQRVKVKDDVWLAVMATYGYDERTADAALVQGRQEAMEVVLYGDEYVRIR